MHPTDFVESYIEAWNRRDANYIAAHFAPDGVYCDVPSQARYSREELIEYLADLFRQSDDYYVLDGEITTGTNSIAFQYKVVPSEDGASTSRLSGVEFVRLNGKQAVQIDDFYQLHGDSSAEQSSAGKYAKSGLGPELLARYKRQLTILMEDDRTYLDASLTLPKLSRLVQCPVNHLSQVINAGFGMSFFDYLNSYRIEEAKRMLRSPQEPAPPILNVAFEVGFNSNSAFYAAFKRNCGQTPAQYRRIHRRNHSPRA